MEENKYQKDIPKWVIQNEDFLAQKNKVVEEARKTLPRAKNKYLKGLPRGNSFFVTVELNTGNNNYENIYLYVMQWYKELISGIISTHLSKSSMFHYGQRINVYEKSVIDWTIVDQNGKEEGNYLGKFIDTYSENNKKYILNSNIKENDFENKINEAIGISAKGDYKEAIRQFTQLLILKPDCANLYYNRGIAYRNNSNYNNAIEDYNNAINIESNNSDYYYARGLAYFYEENFLLSINDYNIAIKLNPNIATYFYNRGIVKLKLNQFNKAIEDFTKAIIIEPKVSDYYYNRGCAYGKVFEFHKAVADATKAIELDPKYADAFYNRGLSKIGIGLLDEAFIDLMKAGEMGIKEAYDVINKYKNDKNDFKMFDLLNLNDAKKYYDYALSCSNSKNFAEAIIYFSKVIDLEDRNIYAYYNRGLAKEEVGDIESAVNDYKKCITINKTFELPYNALGIILAKNKKKYEEAIVCFTDALRANPNLTDALSNRGLAYLMLSDGKNAFVDYTKAIAFEPSNSVYYFYRGISNGLIKNYLNEIEDYEKAIELNPTYGDAYYNLAIAYSESGNKKKSIISFIKAAQLGHYEAQIHLERNKIKW
jgi:tetratricopeptide (TPR) repeat protein